MLIIGIAGGTGSGKTTVVHPIMNELPETEVGIISQDSYYKDNSNLSFDERALINFDHPRAIDFDLLVNHLQELKAAGLDSLPGAGAEILCDRVRDMVSPAKISTNGWLEVMRVAHKLGLVTSATMMFGHIETNLERMEHFAALRQVQSEKPAGAKGFLAFIPWPFQDEDTILKKLKRARNAVTGDEYARMIALSRIMLPNVVNIQAFLECIGSLHSPAKREARVDVWIDPACAQDIGVDHACPTDFMPARFAKLAFSVIDEAGTFAQMT